MMGFFVNVDGVSVFKGTAIGRTLVVLLPKNLTATKVVVTARGWGAGGICICISPTHRATHAHPQMRIPTHSHPHTRMLTLHHHPHCPAPAQSGGASRHHIQGSASIATLRRPFPSVLRGWRWRCVWAVPPVPRHALQGNKHQSHHREVGGDLFRPLPPLGLRPYPPRVAALPHQTPKRPL